MLSILVVKTWFIMVQHVIYYLVQLEFVQEIHPIWSNWIILGPVQGPSDLVQGIHLPPKWFGPRNTLTPPPPPGLEFSARADYKKVQQVRDGTGYFLYPFLCLSCPYFFIPININEPPHDKTNKVACAPSKNSDQPGHPPSLISLRCPHEESLGP